MLMKKELYVHIPTPCHEDWQQMTPVDKGRFCESCTKQVVDFSVMTDQEILNHLSKASGKLCGRFANDQLQRPLQPLKEEKKKFWWIAAMMPLLMLFEKSRAQKNNVTQGAPAITIKTPRTEIMGKMQLPEKQIKVVGDTIISPDIENKILVNGKVIQENGDPLPYATVSAVNISASTIADSLGNFELYIRPFANEVTIQALELGYQTAAVTIDTHNIQPLNLVLKQTTFQLDPIVVTGYGITKGKVELRCSTAEITRTTTLVNKIDTLIRKIFHAEPFKVYPNPAAKGSNVKIDIKNEGVYSIQLFDNNGKLLQVNEFEAAKGATQTSVTIPSSLAAGMYYIRLIDDKTKKQYTDKIVVM